MHILKRPSFLRAKSMGAPYGLEDGTILLLLKKVSIYVFNSASSVSSSGYSFHLGGGRVSSTSRILCYISLLRFTGYVGSLNTYVKLVFNSSNILVASCYNVVASP